MREDQRPTGALDGARMPPPPMRGSAEEILGRAARLPGTTPWRPPAAGPYRVRGVLGVSAAVLALEFAGQAAVALIFLTAAAAAGVSDLEGALDYVSSVDWLAWLFLLSSSAAAIAAFAVLPHWLLKRRGSADLMAWRRPRLSDLGIAVLAAGAAWIIFIAYALARDALGAGPPGGGEGSDFAGIPAAAAFAFAVVLVAPLAEEAFFRGFLCGGLDRAGRRWTAVILSSAAFGLLHVPLDDLTLAWDRMIPFALIGAVFAAAYLRAKNLTAPTLAHGFYNGSVAAAAIAEWAS